MGGGLLGGGSWQWLLQNQQRSQTKLEQNSGSSKGLQKASEGIRVTSVTRKVRNLACGPEQPGFPVLILVTGHAWGVSSGVVVVECVDFVECSGTSWRWRHGTWAL